MANKTTQISWHKPIASIIEVILLIFTLVNLTFAASYTATGQIQTSTGTESGCNLPVTYVKVNVIDDDLVVDDLCGSGFTNANGDFSITFDWTDSDIDMMIDVIGQGELPDGKYVYIKNWGGLNIIDYEGVEGRVFNEPAEGTVPFGTLHLSDNKFNVITKIGQAIRYARNNQASGTNWTVPNDIDAYPRNSYSTPGDVLTYCTGDSISVGKEDWDDPGVGTGGAFSFICHETGHLIQYNAYGDRWPSPSCNPGNHNYDTESCEGFAMMEGWAEFFSYASHIIDLGNAIPSSTIWRGSDNEGDTNTGSVVGMGEIVEGALMNIWVLVNNFGRVFRPIANDSPDFFKAWLASWHSYGYDMPTILTAAQANGIVYSRGKIDGFVQGDPPNSSPPEDGNRKEISNITFLRGNLVINTSQVTNTELKLATNSGTIGVDKKKLGYKIVTTPENLNDNNLTGFNYLGEFNWSDDLEFQTDTILDGTYDLLIKVRNVHSWWDDLKPSFNGDSQASRNSNEKWLKHLQTWYNQDTEASNNDEGKVIIDNMSPTVTNCLPPKN